MRIKPLHIYLIGFILIIAIIFITNRSSDTGLEDNLPSSKAMPKNNIHKGLRSSQSENLPSKDNVVNSFKDKINRLEQAIEKNPNDTAKVKEYARLLAAAHKPEKAIKLYNSILQKDPKRIDLLFELAEIYFGIKQYDAATELLDRIIEINNDNLINHHFSS